MAITAEAGDGGGRRPMFQVSNPVEKYIDLRDKIAKCVGYNSGQTKN